MENALKTLIVDDESLARRGLKHRLRDVDDLEIIAEAANGRQALGLIREHQPDLVFLDIQMPGMDGFDVLRALQPGALPAILFMTVVDDFAINAFKDHGLDYLLKPIEEARLTDALEGIRKNRKRGRASRQKRSLLNLVDQITRPSACKPRGRSTGRTKKMEGHRLAIRDGGRTTWLRQEDIEWIDAAGDYMCVHARGETYIMRVTMKTLERELDSSLLQRVHRSTIVNVNQIRRLQPHINGEYFLTLKCGHTLKLSRSYKDKLRYFIPNHPD